jgi:transcriptional regulator with XRE-family HTH domain
MTATPLVAVSYPAIVGAVLLARRKDSKLSQAQMADAVGLNVSTWSKVENGDSALTIEQLASAASVLGVSPSSILKAAEKLLKALEGRGIATGTSRAALAAHASLGAIPIAGTALLAVLGPVGLMAAGLVNGYAFMKKKAEMEKDDQ